MYEVSVTIIIPLCTLLLLSFMRVTLKTFGGSCVYRYTHAHPVLTVMEVMDHTYSVCVKESTSTGMLLRHALDAAWPAFISDLRRGGSPTPQTCSLAVHLPTNALHLV